MPGGFDFPRRHEVDRRISLQKLEILCLVVELGTVTRAAEQLYVAQPVVTAHLRSLEERLGVKLFSRRGRMLELTEAGELVYRWSAETLARSRTLMRELESLTDGERGAALIGASMSVGSYLLPSILGEFRRTHPRADLTLAIGGTESILTRVEQGELDLGVVIRATSPTSLVLAGDLVGEDDIVLVTAPGGQPAGDEIAIGDLRRVPMLGTPAGTVTRVLVDEALSRYGTPHQDTVLDLGHPEAVKRAVMETFGAALLLRCAVEAELTAGTLREVRLRDARLAVPIYAVRRHDKRLSALQGHLLELIDTSIARRATSRP